MMMIVTQAIDGMVMAMTTVGVVVVVMVVVMVTVMTAVMVLVQSMSVPSGNLVTRRICSCCPSSFLVLELTHAIWQIETET